MVLTLIPLLVSTAASTPTLAAASAAPVMIATIAQPPIEPRTPVSTCTVSSPANPTCFRLAIVARSGTGRAVAWREGSGDRAVLREDGWVVGAAAPGMRTLLGLGSVGMMLTGRMALSRGSAMRLSLDSVSRFRPYEQVQATLAADRQPLRGGY